MQQRISELKDKLRTGVAVGKWRARVIKLGYDRSTGEKERKKAVAALGTLAWERRVEHPDYAEVFAQLVDLEQQRSASQAAITALEADLQQAETHKQQLEADFATQRQAAEQRKQAAMAQLAPKPDGSTATDADPQALQAEITGCEQALTAISAAQPQALAQTHEQLAQLRQAMQAKRDQLASQERQFPALQQRLGEQIDRVRPESTDMTEHYVRLDTLDQDAARLTSELTTLNQQITNAGKGATQTLYWLAGGAAAVVLLLALLLFSGLGMLGGGGGVSEGQMRKDLGGREIFWDVVNVGGPYIGDGSSGLTWNLQPDQIRSLKIVKRKTDLKAGTDTISAHAELRNDVMTVGIDLEFSYRKYEQGWVLEKDLETSHELVIVEVRNQPDTARLEQDIRVAHNNGSNRNSWCTASRMQGVALQGTYGGTDSGSSALVYYVTVNYNPPATARPGQLQAPDLCSQGRDWVVKYQWNGSKWNLERALGV